MFGDSDFLPFFRMEAWRVNGGFVNTDFLTVAWLELGPVLTLCYVDLGIVVSTVMRKFDVNFGIVVSAMVWYFNVDMS